MFICLFVFPPRELPQDSEVHCLSEGTLRLPHLTGMTGPAVSIGGKRGKWLRFQAFVVLTFKMTIQQLDPQAVLILSVFLMKLSLSSFAYACPSLLLSVGSPSAPRVNMLGNVKSTALDKLHV